MHWFFVDIAVAVAILWGLYWLWARRIEAEIAEGAAIEWEKLQTHDKALIDGLDRPKFDEIYRRVHFPRAPRYALAAFSCFLLSLPAIFGLLAAGLLIADRFGVSPAPAELANRYLIDGDGMRIITAAPPEAALYWIRDLGGFYYFFGVLAAWLAIVAFFTRRYHARRPGHLRDEILRAR